MSATAFQRMRRERAAREAKGGTEQESQTASDSLDDKKVPALKEIAKGLNIEGADGMKKADLIAAIQAVGDAV